MSNSQNPIQGKNPIKELKPMEKDQVKSHLAEEIIEEMSKLSREKQQEVLDFVEFLNGKLKDKSTADLVQPKPSNFCEEVVSKHAGYADSGHTDLSTNKAHMEGFGKVWSSGFC